jgi:hypothetical protein
MVRVTASTVTDSDSRVDKLVAWCHN